MTGAVTARKRIGRPFPKGWTGRPKGAKDRRRVLGQEAAKALEAHAWDVIERLLASSSWRARHEAAKTVLAYALGTPKATLEVAGGFGDLSRELAAALQEARLRRASFDVAPSVAPLSASAAPLPALPAGPALTSSQGVTSCKPLINANLQEAGSEPCLPCDQASETGEIEPERKPS